LELTIDHPVVAIVTVPADGVRFPLAPIVKAELTVKVAPVVKVPFKVSPAKVRVPELVKEVEPVSKVIVPPVGARVFPDDIVSALLIV